MQKFVSIKEKAAKYAHHTFWQRGEAVEMHTLYQKNGLTSMGVSENQGKVPIFFAFACVGAALWYFRVPLAGPSRTNSSRPQKR